MTRSTDTEITIRRLNEADRADLRRLAERDSAGVPVGRLIGAFRGGSLIAATQIDSRRPSMIADPFEETADAAALLQIRRQQVTTTQRFSLRSSGARGHRRTRPAIAS